MVTVTNDSIRISNLCKNYGSFQLENVSFTLPQGCIMGLIGENGAGKSTTLKLILNLIRRDSGKISIFGLDPVKEERKIKEQIGVVFDENFFTTFSVHGIFHPFCAQFIPIGMIVCMIRFARAFNSRGRRKSRNIPVV